MEIRTWEILHIFEALLKGKDIQMSGVDLPKPIGLDDRIRKSWAEQLLKKQTELSRTGITVDIRPYHLDSSKDPLGALYEGDTPKMWPGPVVTLREVERDITHGSNRVILRVGQMFYPYIVALQDPEIIKLYEVEGIDIPTPALGICTPVLTADNQLALTVRGSRTSIYPGRMHSPGGQPLLVNTDVIQHQRDEIKEEILVDPKELVGEFYFSGMVLDQEIFKNKPDLTGWVRTELDAGNIREKLFKTDPAKRPPDVQGVVFAPATESGLLAYMTEYTNPVNFCPPTVGSLWLFGRSQYGQDWANDVIKKLGYQ